MNATQLIETARPIVNARGRRAGLNEADLEDLLQDVVSKYLAAFTANAPDNLAAWVETATAHAVIDRLRAAQRRPADHLEDDALTLAVGAMRSTRFASLGPVRRDVIDTILGLVPAVDARLLQRRYLDGESAADVAAELGIVPVTVDQRTTRAKRRLRDALAGRPDLLEELRLAHPRVY